MSLAILGVWDDVEDHTLGLPRRRSPGLQWEPLEGGKNLALGGKDVNVNLELDLFFLTFP